MKSDDIPGAVRLAEALLAAMKRNSPTAYVSEGPDPRRTTIDGTFDMKRVASEILRQLPNISASLTVPASTKASRQS